MAGEQLGRLVQKVRVLAASGGPAPPDGELLRRFATDRDEAAFSALVWRHAPMVLGVCRRVLGDHHDAEDACQAAFLLLAQKAASIRNRHSVASWLHGAAYRIAANLRRRLARRRTAPLRDDVPQPDPAAGASWGEVRAALDDELARLPERYRAPLALCCLEGLTRDEAARQLGWRLATLRTRLGRGRALLRGRLARRGLALSAALLAAGLARGAAGAAPAALVLATVGATTRGTAPPHVVALVEGAMRAMLLSKLKSLAGVVLALGVVLAVAGGVARRGGAPAEEVTRAAPPASALPAPAGGQDGEKQEETVKAELKKLEGAWKVVATESDGRKARAEDVEDSHYVFGADGKWKLMQDGRVAARGTFTLDPAKKPRTIDFAIDESIHPEDKGKVSPGIYELDGDSLKVCRAGPGGATRPTDFTAAAGSKRVLATYRRAKDADTEDPPEDVADVASRRLTAGGDENKRYFLIGAEPDRKAPKGGYGLLLVLPGGDGGKDFNPFVRRIWKNGLPEGYLVAQLMAPKWADRQKVVWPTAKLQEAKMKFGTEEFIAAVVADVTRRQTIDRGRVFALGWSSGGPAVYAASLAKGSPLTGTFAAMAVFDPDLLPDLASAKGRAWFIYHSKDDRLVPFRFAEQAKEALEKNGAKVQLRTYDGGHGWRGNVYGDIQDGIDWLEKNHGKPPAEEKPAQ